MCGPDLESDVSLELFTIPCAMQLYQMLLGGGPHRVPRDLDGYPTAVGSYTSAEGQVSTGRGRHRYHDGYHLRECFKGLIHAGDHGQDVQGTGIAAPVSVPAPRVSLGAFHRV